MRFTGCLHLNLISPNRYGCYGLGRLVGRLKNENRQCLCGLGRRYGWLPPSMPPRPKLRRQHTPAWAKTAPPPKA
jgi:hypothetical protein